MDLVHLLCYDAISQNDKQIQDGIEDKALGVLPFGGWDMALQKVYQCILTKQLVRL